MDNSGTSTVNSGSAALSSGSGGSNTTNIHTIVKAQIVFLLSTLTEDNFDRNLGEIRSLSEQHGIDTYTHFIRRLIQQSQPRSSSGTAPPTPSATEDTSALTFRLLVQEMQRVGRDPSVAERFREAIDKGEGDTFRQFDLRRLAEKTNLKPLEKVILGSAFVSCGASPTHQSSTHSGYATPTSAAPATPTTSGTNVTAVTFSARKPDLVTQAINMIRSELENAIHALSQLNCFETADIDMDKLGRMLVNLLCDPAPPEPVPVLEATQRFKLLKAVQDKYGRETASRVMLRVFPTLSLPPGSSLVQLLNQLGPDLTDDPQVVRALLTRFKMTDDNPPRDSQVLEIMSTMARLASEGASLCDVGSLVRALSSYRVKIDWASVIRSFDSQDRPGVDTATLKLLIAILLNSPREQEPHAVTGFWGIWSNPLLQLRLLDALLSLPGDTFNFVQLPGRRIVTVDNVSIASPTIKSLAANVQGHTWNCLELFEVLVRMAGSDSVEIRTTVKEMLDKAIKISAELVHMGLLQVPDASWNEIRTDYSRKLLAMFLAGHPNHQLVFMRIWQIQPTYLTNAFRDFYDENPLNITRILDVAQDLKILEALLDVRPFTFALDVASLASRREYLNLDKWLADNVTNHGEEFLHSIILFLDQKMESEKATRLSDTENRTMALSPSTITLFLRILRNSTVSLSPENAQYCLEVRNACLQIHPRLMSLAPGSEIEPGFSVANYSPEVEAEVDSIYKQMYDENITIDEVITMLQQHKESTNPRDHEIFSCMIHFLFDEYKFFQCFYPPRELAMTGYLFGSLIQFKLIDYIPLGIAVRYIIDALNCPPDTNLFKFGVQALSRFESRLSEWQPLCQSLLQIPHLAEAHPDLVLSIQRASASAGDADGTQLPVPEPIPVFTAIQPDVIEDTAITAPPEELSDKMLFIVNNLDPNNFTSKVKAMKEAFQEEYSHWFANYLVDQRVSTEPNNHQLYLRLLDSMNSKALMKYILYETFTKSAQLLNSESTLHQGTERTVLKHVGTWLGLITLARDQPIKFKNLSLKDLLIEGHDNSRLPVAIPFVCKTLEPCAKSKVFKPPNPWLMAVLCLLAELYHFADMKLNLKFEIDVLCKSLDVDLATLEATTILRNRPTTESMAGPPLPEYVSDIDALPMSGYTGAASNEAQVFPTDAAGGAGGDMQRVLGDHIESILEALVQNVQLSPQIHPYNVNPLVKRTVQMAVERAVREIILPVVEQSVIISGISMRELVTKDFAMESNEDKLRKAGQLMAQKLAGGLALVTCKEPLRSNLGQHLRRSFTEQGLHELAQDEVINILTQGNLELACQAVEKAAMERAAADVDENLDPGIQVRRRYRELRTNQTFWDPAVSQTTIGLTLPEPLKLKASGLQAIQAAVYEDFCNDGKRKFPAMVSRPTSTIPRPDTVINNNFAAVPNRMVPYLSHQEIVEQFSSIFRDIEALLAQLPVVNKIGVTPPNHELRHLVETTLVLANQSGEKPRTPMYLSQKIVQAMYKTSSQLGRDVYCTLLDRLCSNFEDVGKEVATWLLYAEDERKYNVLVTATMLRSGLIDVEPQDMQLRTFLLKDPKPSLQTFVAGLIRECLTCEPPIATQRQFSASLEVLKQLVQAGTANDDVVNLIADLGGVRRPDTVPPTDVPARQPSTRPENEHLREKLFGWFQQWVTIFQRSHNPEKSFVPFITQLTKQGILKVEDLSSFFFRVCAESSVTSYIKCMQAGEYEYAFQALDAMSRLIAYIIKYHGDASGVNNDQAKVHYFTKILSIFVLVLSNYHEDDTIAFQQKPFFRFFSSLVNDLNGIESQLGPAYFQLLLALSDTFSSLQPTYFPGFSFSWMCLISHRLFMPKLLLSENREGWSPFHKLLLSLFKFLSPFLKDANLQHAAQDLYRGTLRLLLVLIHDFPEFLSEYYFTLCDAIPLRCIQLRNIVLSAFPPSQVLPDPYLRNISLDKITEMGPIPTILSDFTSGLKNGDTRAYLDQYLLNRGGAAILPSLIERIKQTTPSEGPGETYNLSLMNAMVMYIGVSSVAQVKARTGGFLFVATDPGVTALQYLAENLDHEGQHHLLSSIVLHLRYPNAHTHWFSCLMVHLFHEINDNRFREIMTKVLLERFLVHRPHPWGVTVTFIELLRNPKYDFWSKEFVQVAPEVTLLLERVAVSIFT